MAEKARKNGIDGAEPKAKKGRAGKPKVGKVVVDLNTIPSEVIFRNLTAVHVINKELEEHGQKGSGIRGRLRSAFEVAEKDGLPKRYIQRFFSDAKRDPEDVRKELEFEHRASREFGKDNFTAQLDMFRDPNASPVKRPVDEGYAAGRNGESADNNAYKPGTEESQQWQQGWLRGQEEIVNGMKPDAVAPATASSGDFQEDAEPTYRRAQAEDDLDPPPNLDRRRRRAATPTVDATGTA